MSPTNKYIITDKEASYGGLQHWLMKSPWHNFSSVILQNFKSNIDDHTIFLWKKLNKRSINIKRHNLRQDKPVTSGRRLSAPSIARCAKENERETVDKTVSDQMKRLALSRHGRNGRNGRPVGRPASRRLQIMFQRRRRRRRGDGVGREAKGDKAAIGAGGCGQPTLSEEGQFENAGELLQHLSNSFISLNEIMVGRREKIGHINRT